MILFKITNTKNNKVYFNYKNSLPVSLNRIKNKDIKNDLEKYGVEIFNIDILLTSNTKKDIQIILKKIISKFESFPEKYTLYNKSSKGKIIVKDENGKNIKIDVTDERYTSGKFKHVSFGKIPVIDKETLQKKTVYSNDPLYNIRYIPITKGKVVTKDKEGNLFFIDKTDSRYKKELIPMFIGAKISNHRLNTILETNKIKRKSKFLNFDLEIKHDNKSKKYIIEKFCKHGDLIIDKKVFNFLYKEDKIFLCEQCKKEYYENYIFNEKELEYFQTLYVNCNINLYTESYVKIYQHKLYYYINKFSEHIPELPWVQKVYLFRHNLKQIPLCNYNNCSKNSTYNYTMKCYNMYCEIHAKHFSTSIKEKEIYNFIKSVYNGKIEENIKKIIDKELDIFIPEFSLGIEFNGLYWHSEIYKEKNYHKNKWESCKNNNINLITIWEDDWNIKQNIIKSIIQNALHVNLIKVSARKCIIRNLSFIEKSNFLNDNHLQGTCPSSINLGLFYNDELVSVMTFGKKRMVLKSKSNSSNEYELLRFCNKVYYSVRGSASKLFKYFIENYKPNIVISYSNLDLGEGNIYKILGFKDCGYTSLNYWWTDFINKYHRSNFMKHRLIREGADQNKSETIIMHEKGFAKIWGVGNKKWILEL